METTSAGGVLVYIQATARGIARVFLEVLGKAAELANLAGQPLYGVVAADRPELSALSGRGLARVFVYSSPLYRYFRADCYADAVCDCVARLSPSIFLLGATPEARSFAPAAAARLHTGLTADCTQLSIGEAGELIQTRPAFSGDIMASIVTPDIRPQMAIVRPGVMEPRRAQTNTPPVFIPMRIESPSPRLEVLAAHVRTAFDSGITESKIVVAVGGGLAGKDDLPLFESLARHLGGTLACSRVLVERGWMPAERQIGLSGAIVSPNVLLTLGISGSVQFISGIGRTRTVISMNTEKDAPIFSVSDYGFVCDMYALAPLLLNGALPAPAL